MRRWWSTGLLRQVTFSRTEKRSRKKGHCRQRTVCIQSTYVSEQLERICWNSRRELDVPNLRQSLLLDPGLPICWAVILLLRPSHSPLVSYHQLVNVGPPCENSLPFLLHVHFYISPSITHLQTYKLPCFGSHTH